MTTSTYTVFNELTGKVEGRGLSVTEAANLVLSQDGGIYELRRSDARFDMNFEPQWLLFTKRLGEHAMSGPCYSSGQLISAYAPTAEAAWPEIAAQVLTDCPGKLAVLRDFEYDAMLAEGRAK